jgi:CubicO group peptidase (beta-lactamase class C family)
MALFLAGCSPGTEHASSASDRLDDLFSPLQKGTQPGVAVMVVHNGKVLHQKGYGYADIKRKIPISAQTAFRLGSVSKQFTAMAIMQLAEQGKLGYDDLIGDYVPELAVYKGVTIRHLLTHTGGLPEYYDDIDVTHGMPSNADAAALLGEMASPVFPPGERYEYSNPGYDMLANVVTAASGVDFVEFSQQNIFAPLHMDSTTIHDHTQPVIQNRALGYDPDGDGFKLNDEDPLNGIVGSGGVYSTLEDMYKWDQALYGETLVSKKTLQEAFTSATNNAGEPIDYGFGWRIDEYKGERRIWHTGSWIGFRARFVRFPDIGLSIVMLSNRGDLGAVLNDDVENSYEKIEKIADIYLEDLKN